MDAILVHGFGKSGSSKLGLSNLGETIWRPNLSRAFAALAILAGRVALVSIAVRYSEGIRAVRFGCVERLLSADRGSGDFTNPTSARENMWSD
jgi:hypothetical protein